MRNIRSKFTALKAAVGTAMLVPMVAFAQATPPATPADLANSVNLSSVVPAVFTIFGLLIGVGVSLWAGRLIISKFRPKA